MDIEYSKHQIYNLTQVSNSVIEKLNKLNKKSFYEAVYLVIIAELAIFAPLNN